VHQRAIGVAGARHQGRERPGAGLPHQLLGGGLRTELGGRVHRTLRAACALAIQQEPEPVNDVRNNLTWRTGTYCLYDRQQIDESRIWRRIVTFQPSFTGFKAKDFRPTGDFRLMPTIALVDDDRNILTSVSIALEAE